MSTVQAGNIAQETMTSFLSRIHIGHYIMALVNEMEAKINVNLANVTLLSSITPD